jgi:hypothetical protein
MRQAAVAIVPVEMTQGGHNRKPVTYDVRGRPMGTRSFGIIPHSPTRTSSVRRGRARDYSLVGAASGQRIARHVVPGSNVRTGRTGQRPTVFDELAGRELPWHEVGSGPSYR